MSEVPLYVSTLGVSPRGPSHRRPCLTLAIQGYLAHKKPPPHLGPPKEPRHGPTVGSYGETVSYERGTPVCVYTGSLAAWVLAQAPLPHSRYTSLYF